VYVLDSRNVILAACNPAVLPQRFRAQENPMPAYPRENPQSIRAGPIQATRGPSFQKHPAKFRAIHCRHEVLEGSAIEDIIILEFPSYQDAKAWYL
jgi:hypothetical protein